MKEKWYHIKGTPSLTEMQPSSSKYNFIKCRLYYHEGGYSFATYKPITRGYYISVGLYGRGKDGCGTWESFHYGHPATAMLIKAVENKRSKKVKEEMIAYFDSNADSFVKEVFPEIETEVEA